MEKRLLLAAVLSLAVLALWELLIPKPKRPATATPSVAGVTPAAVSPAPAAQSAAQPARAPQPVSLPPPISGREQPPVVVENNLVRASFSNRGAVLTSLVLLHHTDDEKRPLEIVRQLPPPAEKPLSVDFPSRPDLTGRVRDALFAVAREPDGTVRFSYADADVAVTKQVRFQAGYLFDVKVSVVGPPYLLVVGTGLRNLSPEEQASRYVMPASAIAATGGGFSRARPEKLDKPVEWPLAGGGFAGLEDN